MEGSGKPFRTALLWSILCRKRHPAFEDDVNVMDELVDQLVDHLFPGICWGKEDVEEVVDSLLHPTIDWLFPEMHALGVHEVGKDEDGNTDLMTVVPEVLRTEAGQWREISWKTALIQRLQELVPEE